jgi:hypothetical protein
MPAILLPYRSCRTPDGYSIQSRGSRLSIQLARASIVRDHLRDPLQLLQRLKNKVLKRQSINSQSTAGGVASYSYANSSLCPSLADITTGGSESPRFERPTLSREDAIQQHKIIEFRQRFLALPGELRNQIYDEVISINANDQSHIRQFRPATGLFLYTESEHETSGPTVHIRSKLPQPQNLQFVREQDHIWEELMDRWMVHAEVELSRAIDIGGDDNSCGNYESLNCLHQSPLGSIVPRPRKARDLFPQGKLDFYKYRWISSCTISLSIYNVNFNFADGPMQPHCARLHTAIREFSGNLNRTVRTTNLRINVSLWPGEYLDKSYRGWAPFFENDADVEGLWTLLRPLKSVAGVQSVRVKRLRGNALWSTQPNSLYPESPPLVVVEKSGLSIDGWLGWDRGWGTGWDWGVLGKG